MNIDDADLCVYQKVKLSWGEGGGRKKTGQENGLLNDAL